MYEMKMHFLSFQTTSISGWKPYLVGTEPGTNRSWLLILGQTMQLVGIAAPDPSWSHKVYIVRI